MKIFIIIFFFGLGAEAKISEPSLVSCQVYTELKAENQCTNTDYLNVAETACGKYLAKEPSSSPALRIFLPPIRKCLQRELLKTTGPGFCENLLKTAESSHIKCYLENHYCDLSPIDQATLGKIMWRKLPTSPWAQTAVKINWACAKNLLNRQNPAPR